MQIVFDSFKVRTDNLVDNSALGAWVAYGKTQCVEDWLEIYQIYQDRSEELVGRYCANSAPGPVVSLRKIAVGLKVYLHTDEKDVYSGFMGRYMFFEEKSEFGGMKKLSFGVIWCKSGPLLLEFLLSIRTKQNFALKNNKKKRILRGHKSKSFSLSVTV